MSQSQKIKRWKERLEALTELTLPTDYPRPIPSRIVEAEHDIEISEATSLAILKLSLGIKALPPSHTHTASPFSVLLGAFSVLLHRWTGEEDISVGSSSSSSNPLVLRMKVQETQSFVSVVNTVLEAEKDASDDEIPFDALLKAFAADPDPGAAVSHEDLGHNHRQSLFKVRFFNMTDTTPDTLASTSKTSSSTDISIFISQSPSLRRLLPIQIKVIYNSVLFSESRISIMMNQLEILLQNAAEFPSSQIGKISLVGPESRPFLPDPTADLHWDAFQGAITDIFAKNASIHPDRLCVVESVDATPNNPRSFSYKAINEASNVLAHHLIKNGIKREDVVVLYSYRGVDLVVAVMGVLKAGATFSVIDPAYPPARQNVYLQVSKPKGLVILKKAGVLFPEVRAFIEHELKIVCEVPALEINDMGVLSGGASPDGSSDILQPSQTLASTDPGVELGPDSIGTLSFTSGSTGIPKGVRGRHFSLTHFYPWMSQEFQLGANDRFTMLSGIAHDPIQRDIFTPLFLGAIICIPTAEDIGVPGKLAEWMASFEVSVTHLTPAMGQLLSANATKPIPSLRHAFFVGDVLTKRDVMRLQLLASNTHVINMYGTTETQRAVSYLKIPPVSANPGFLSEQKDIMPAGKGMQNVQLLVVNKSGLLAGVGEVGEIYVRSGGLAEGYLALPEVTSEKFIMNPFVAEKSPSASEKKIPYYHGARDRMYRTGDLGRYRPDGNVECTGRSDDQVKIRGFRIELKEIDTHLSQHADVRENVTLVRRDKYEEKTLVCYFVPFSKSASEMNDVIRDIRNYLKQKLPSYAIPSVFVPLTRMPLTPNGKIDKNALPFPDTALAAAKSGVDTDDLSPLQTSLREVWAKLLKMPATSISLTDNFFDLGGHSILATQLVFEVRKALAVEAPLGMVYRAPVFNAMVAEVDYLRGGDLNMTHAAVAPNSAVDASPSRPPDLNAPEIPESYREEIFDYAGDLQKIDDSFIAANGRTVDYTSLHAGNPAIFVTGVTGFLGAFILASAFKNFPGANIYCLVRAKSNEIGLERIIDNCKRHLVWNEKWKSALHAIAGDLGAEKFGCDLATWDKLCTTVDTIIHNGALVHWIYPYQKLKGPNVTGTLTALAMATEKRLIPIHFVSSTSVLDTEHYVNKLVLGTSVFESDNLQGSKTGLRSGYGQTKWVAEQLILQARSRGVPATIIRPGYIVGDSISGVTNTDDFIWRLVKGCIQLGHAPRIFNVVNMCSVDYVADCVVHVAKNPASIELGVFHTWNPHGFKFDDLFASIITAYDVQQTDYIQWRTSLLELTLSTADHALFPLLHFVLDDLPTSTKSPELDDANTRLILKGTGVACAKMDALLPLYLGYLVHVGFLEPSGHSKFPQIKDWSLLSKDKLVARSGV